MHANDIRREEVNRLPEHARLGFNAAHAPANDAEAVDHRSVRIRANERVGIVNAALFQHALGEVFKVHLMHNTDAGRDDLERVERLHAPLQELVALAVAGEFQIQILRHRVRRTGEVHLHRVVHDEIHRHERLDDLRILADLVHRAAHRCEVHEQRHTGEVLQHDAGDHERDLRRAFLGRLPIRELLHVRFLHLEPVAITQHGFQHETDADRQLGDGADAGRFQCGKRIKLAGLAVAEVERLQCVEQVMAHKKFRPDNASRVRQERRK